MRIGILGDIHGNIDALQAVYSAARDHHLDALYHLGDLGGYAPFVNEVVEFLVEHAIAGVQGNYDETVANDADHCGCKYENEQQAQMAERGFAWTKRAASESTKTYLRGLPRSLMLKDHGRTIALFHASPLKNNLYWTADRPEKFFREMADKLPDTDVYIFGHTHIPFRKDLDGKVFINAGSVGKPKDGDPRACLTVVETTPSGMVSEFVRVAYDVERTATAIKERGLPEYFAERLLAGR